MHVPDGFVSPTVAGAVVAVAELALRVHLIRLDVTERQLPLAGLAAHA